MSHHRRIGHQWTDPRGMSPGIGRGMEGMVGSMKSVMDGMILGLFFFPMAGKCEWRQWMD